MIIDLIKGWYTKEVEVFGGAVGFKIKGILDKPEDERQEFFEKRLLGFVSKEHLLPKVLNSKPNSNGDILFRTSDKNTGYEVVNVLHPEFGSIPLYFRESGTSLDVRYDLWTRVPL